jgi:inhibitor of KinA sporulation pathway (predicted exonuclease)
MKKNLDFVLVVDLETTCWEGPLPPGQENEIIEIGICFLNVASGERLRKESLIVKPKSQISPFCTKLTTLTQADVDRGIPLADACAALVKMGSKNHVWASYGDFDRRQFEKECRSKNIPYPFGNTHWNVKNLFALRRKLAREVGMAEALEMLKIPLEGTHHRGGDDAYNIAAILAELLR